MERKRNYTYIKKKARKLTKPTRMNERGKNLTGCGAPYGEAFLRLGMWFGFVVNELAMTRGVGWWWVGVAEEVSKNDLPTCSVLSLFVSVESSLADERPVSDQLLVSRSSSSVSRELFGSAEVFFWRCEVSKKSEVESISGSVARSTQRPIPCKVELWQGKVQWCLASKSNLNELAESGFVDRRYLNKVVSFSRGIRAHRCSSRYVGSLGQHVVSTFFVHFIRYRNNFPCC